MGSNTACAIYASTSGLYCWGNTGLSPFSKVPVEVAGGGAWLAVCTFKDNVCGIQSGGAMFCWGSTNSNGQLGIGNTSTMTAPAPVAGGYTWAVIATHSEANVMCGIHANLSLSCWGQNTNGVVGDGTTADRTSPTAVLGSATWKTVSIGTNHACGISTASRLFCWGDRQYGQLGTGIAQASSYVTSPSEVYLGGWWSALSTGDQRTCAIRASGELLCWGYNQNGWLLGGTTAAVAPKLIDNSTDWAFVVVSAASAFAIKSNGTLYGWGTDSAYGQLGGNATVSRTAPTLAVTQLTFSQVAMHGTATCALSGTPAPPPAAPPLPPAPPTTPLSVNCFGTNRAGMGLFGTGPLNTDAAQWVPTTNNATDFVQVGVSWNTACGRAAGSLKLYCWGGSTIGLLGDGTIISHQYPIEVAGSGQWQAVQVMYTFVCGIRISGDLYCWGPNAYVATRHALMRGRGGDWPEKRMCMLQERPAGHWEYSGPAVPYAGPRWLQLDGHPQQRGRPKPVTFMRYRHRRSHAMLGRQRVWPTRGRHHHAADVPRSGYRRRYLDLCRHRRNPHLRYSEQLSNVLLGAEGRGIESRDEPAIEDYALLEFQRASAPRQHGSPAGHGPCPTHPCFYPGSWLIDCGWQVSRSILSSRSIQRGLVDHGLCWQQMDVRYTHGWKRDLVLGLCILGQPWQRAT